MFKTKKILSIAVLIAVTLLAVYAYTVLQKDKGDNLSGLYPVLTAAQRGTISQNEVKSHNIFIGRPADKLSFSLEWKDASNQLGMELVDPDGIILKQNSPGIEFKDDLSRRIYAIPGKTKIGKWTMRVLGSGVNGSEEYAVGGAYHYEKTLIVWPSPTAATPGETVRINSFYSSSGKMPISPPNSLDLDRIQDVAFSNKAEATVVRPDGTEEILPLFDDGLHSDKNFGDGVFGNSYKNTKQNGTYHVGVVHYLDQNLVHEKSGQFEVLSLYKISLSNLKLSNDAPKESEKVIITADVSNLSNSALKGIAVQLYADNVSLSGPPKRIDLIQGETKTVTFEWIAKGGQVALKIVVYPDLLSDFSVTIDANQLQRSVVVQ